MIEKVIEQLKQCTSYSEASRIVFGIDYYNASVKSKLVHYCNNVGIDILTVIHENKNKKKYCLQCGKLLNQKQSKFCSSSCAATYNNHRREHTEKTKQKISETLLRRYEAQGGKHANRENSIVRVFECTCKTCGKQFLARKKNSKHCSYKCSAHDPEVQEKLRKKQLALVEKGEHEGWKTRNIKSYAERFWETVLNNNNIEYIRETHDNGKYFIDFEIHKDDIVIDLEIDGKQHRYKERVENDKKRDAYHTNLGYVVYRIEWNEINTDKGKKMMEDKINAFVNFYTSL